MSEQALVLKWDLDDKDLEDWLVYNNFVVGCDIYDVLKDFINSKYRTDNKFSKEDLYYSLQFLFNKVTAEDLCRHRIVGLNRFALIQMYLRDSFKFRE